MGYQPPPSDMMSYPGQQPQHYPTSANDSATPDTFTMIENAQQKHSMASRRKSEPTKVQSSPQTRKQSAIHGSPSAQGQLQKLRQQETLAMDSKQRMVHRANQI